MVFKGHVFFVNINLGACQQLNADNRHYKGFFQVEFLFTKVVRVTE
jgi:hypothetical protein